MLGDFASCPPSLFGKYKVSIMVPLFISVTVPGGCRSQGCYGYPTCSPLVLVAPSFFQAPSPSSSIVDEFNSDLKHPHPTPPPVFFLPLIQSVLMGAWNGGSWLGCGDLPAMGAVFYLGAGWPQRKPLDTSGTHLPFK